MKTSFPSISDGLQGRGDCDSVLERDIVGLLYRRAICNGICEGKTELDDVCKI